MGRLHLPALALADSEPFNIARDLAAQALSLEYIRGALGQARVVAQSLAAPADNLGMVQGWYHPKLAWIPRPVRAFLAALTEPILYWIVQPLLHPEYLSNPDLLAAKFVGDHAQNQTAAQKANRYVLAYRDRQAVFIASFFLAVALALQIVLFILQGGQAYLPWGKILLILWGIASSQHIIWQSLYLNNVPGMVGYEGKTWDLSRLHSCGLAADIALHSVNHAMGDICNAIYMAVEVKEGAKPAQALRADPRFIPYLNTRNALDSMLRTYPGLTAMKKAKPDDIIPLGQKMDETFSLIAKNLHLLEQNRTMLMDNFAGYSPELSNLIDQRLIFIQRRLSAFTKSQGSLDTKGSPRPVDLMKSLDTVISYIQPTRIGEQLSIKIEHDPALPTAMIDEDLISEVWLNLIRNAADAAVQKHTPFRIYAYQENGMIVIELSDWGPGISKEIQSQVFEHEFTTKTTGHGIGLWLASEIVKDAGGAITLDSLDSASYEPLSLPPALAHDFNPRHRKIAYEFQADIQQSLNGMVALCDRLLTMLQSDDPIDTASLRVMDDELQSYRFSEKIRAALIKVGRNTDANNLMPFSHIGSHLLAHVRGTIEILEENAQRGALATEEKQHWIENIQTTKRHLDHAQEVFRHAANGQRVELGTTFRIQLPLSPAAPAESPSIETNNPNERDIARYIYRRRNSHLTFAPSNGPRIKKHFKGRRQTWNEEQDYDESSPEALGDTSPQPGSAPSAIIGTHWNAAWPLPTEADRSQAEESLIELLRMSQRSHGTRELGDLWGSRVRFGNAGKIARELRTLYFLYPTVAGALAADFDIHGSWAELLSEHQMLDGTEAMEPKLIGALINQAGKHDIERSSSFQHPTFGDIDFKFNPRLNGLAGVLGYLPLKRSLAILSSVDDRYLPALADTLIKFVKHKKDVSSNVRDRWLQVLSALGPRYSRIEGKLSIEARMYLADIRSLQSIPKPVAARVTMPMARVSGRGVGKLVVLRDQEPSLQILRSLPQNVIVAMETLPTSDPYIQRMNGILTFREAGQNSHADKRALFWGIPHALWPGPESLEVLEGRTVMLEVTKNQVRLEPISDLNAAAIVHAHASPSRESIKLGAVQSGESPLLLRPTDRRAADPEYVGYKIASINELARHPIEVSDPLIRVRVATGAALPFRTFTHVLTHNGVLGKYISSQHMYGHLDDFAASPELKEEIEVYLDTLGGRGVYVRPSTNAEDLPDYPGLGAGIYITVPHRKSFEQVCRAIQEGYASVFGSKAYQERAQFSIDTRNVQTAMGLFPSEPADYAFVIHTSDVLTEQPDDLVIELVQGQGESLVSDDEMFAGLPTRLVWNKRTKTLVSSEASTKQRKVILAETEGTLIRETDPAKEFLKHPEAPRLTQALIEAGEQVEAIKKSPQDVEGVLRADRSQSGRWDIALVQTRKISRLTNHEPAESAAPANPASEGPEIGPYGMVAKAAWGKLLLECLSGGVRLAELTLVPEVQELIEVYPALNALIQSKNLKELEKFLAFTVGPQQETSILFIDPAIRLLKEVRSVFFKRDNDAMDFIRDSVWEIVLRAAEEHRWALFPGIPRLVELTDDEVLELAREMMRWTMDLQEYLFIYGVHPAPDVAKAKEDLNLVAAGLASEHHDYNQNVNARKKDYTHRPYAMVPKDPLVTPAAKPDNIQALSDRKDDKDLATRAREIYDAGKLPAASHDREQSSARARGDQRIPGPKALERGRHAFFQRFTSFEALSRAMGLGYLLRDGKEPEEALTPLSSQSSDSNAVATDDYDSENVLSVIFPYSDKTDEILSYSDRIIWGALNASGVRVIRHSARRGGHRAVRPGEILSFTIYRSVWRTNPKILIITAEVADQNGRVLSDCSFLADIQEGVIRGHGDELRDELVKRLGRSGLVALPSAPKPDGDVVALSDGKGDGSHDLDKELPAAPAAKERSEDNVSFGTICEREHTQEVDGLNAQLKGEFQELRKLLHWEHQPGKLLTPRDVDDAYRQTPRSLGSWANFRQQFPRFLAEHPLDGRVLPTPEIFFMHPPEGRLFWWVNGRYAAAHFNREENKIYISAPLVAEIGYNRARVIAYHDTLHIAGLTHDEAGALHRQVDPEIDDVIRELAEKELSPAPAGQSMNADAVVPDPLSPRDQETYFGIRAGIRISPEEAAILQRVAPLIHSSLQIIIETCDKLSASLEAGRLPIQVLNEAQDTIETNNYVKAVEKNVYSETPRVQLTFFHVFARPLVEVQRTIDLFKLHGEGPRERLEQTKEEAWKVDNLLRAIESMPSQPAAPADQSKESRLLIDSMHADEGQDLVEYSILIGGVAALLAAGWFMWGWMVALSVVGIGLAAMLGAWMMAGQVTILLAKLQTLFDGVAERQALAPESKARIFGSGVAGVRAIIQQAALWPIIAGSLASGIFGYATFAIARTVTGGSVHPLPLLANLALLGVGLLGYRMANNWMYFRVKGAFVGRPRAALPASIEEYPSWLDSWKAEVERLLHEGKAFPDAVRSAAEAEVFQSEASDSESRNRWFVLNPTGTDTTLYFRAATGRWWQYAVNYRNNELTVGHASPWRDNERIAFERLLAAWQCFGSTHNWIAYSSRHSRISTLYNVLLMWHPELEREQRDKVRGIGRRLENLSDDLHKTSEQFEKANSSRVIDLGTLARGRQLLEDTPSQLQAIAQRLPEAQNVTKFIDDVLPRGHEALKLALPFYIALRELVTGTAEMSPHRLTEALNPIEADLAELNLRLERWSKAATDSKNPEMNLTTDTFLEMFESFCKMMDQGVIREAWLGKGARQELDLVWPEEEVLQLIWYQGNPGTLGLMVQGILLGAIARAQGSISNSAHVAFTVERRDESLVLSVRDNGRKLDSESMVTPAVVQFAELLGGRLELHSTPFEGNVVKAILPRPPFEVNPQSRGNPMPETKLRLPAFAMVSAVGIALGSQLFNNPVQRAFAQALIAFGAMWLGDAVRYWLLERNPHEDEGSGLDELSNPNSRHYAKGRALDIVEWNTVLVFSVMSVNNLMLAGFSGWHSVSLVAVTVLGLYFAKVIYYAPAPSSTPKLILLSLIVGSLAWLWLPALLSGSAHHNVLMSWFQLAQSHGLSKLAFALPFVGLNRVSHPSLHEQAHMALSRDIVRAV